MQVQNERSMFSAKKREFDFLLSNPYPGPAVSGNSGSFTNNPLRQEALKMPFGTVAPVSSSSPFMTSNSFAGPTEALSGFGGVKESGGFSFGLGASSGTANGVPIPNSLLPESPPFRGFSFGVQPSKTGQVSSPQNVFSSSSQPFSGFGQTSLNFNSVMSNPSSVSSPQYVFSSSPQPFSGFGQTSLDFNSITGNPSPAPRDLFGRGNSFQATNETEVSASLPPPSQPTLGGQDSMTQMVTELTKQMPAAPFSHQYVGLSDTKADIWSKETWDLGEIPEEEPPLYAR
ncbi:hypothetical protein L7F22_016175 [Adiantum nelumboides]|nr:hypothetical protein [Adiantum nelumboides]